MAGHILCDEGMCGKQQVQMTVDVTDGIGAHGVSLRGMESAGGFTPPDPRGVFGQGAKGKGATGAEAGLRRG
ncbi:hypothetical protein GCM10007291_29090 [Gemmobacter nanjingensis]|uniref:Uncharacterized protein n=1 Tax=Gemmobacter nanjingensis TaxID=488454 RepID=A0ABQ3FJZ9_9RHOB|nr:hypothetical protein GCM10007291_29090 [Gemmobacter nanjingensis]